MQQDINPHDLHPNPWNPNQLDAINLKKLESSIKKDGIAKPIICRQLDTGVIEILDGEHRVLVAKKLGIEQIPVRILTDVTDGQAKRITILGNSRYGEDDRQKMTDLLLDESIGTAEELLAMLPIDEDELSNYFSKSEDFSSLDDLGDPDDLDHGDTDGSIDLDSPSGRTHQIMRFRVPVEHVEAVETAITRMKHQQGLTEGDELTNNGEALAFWAREVTGE